MAHGALRPLSGGPVAAECVRARRRPRGARATALTGPALLKLAGCLFLRPIPAGLLRAWGVRLCALLYGRRANNAPLCPHTLSRPIHRRRRRTHLPIPCASRQQVDRDCKAAPWAQRQRGQEPLELLPAAKSSSIGSSPGPATSLAQKDSSEGRQRFQRRRTARGNPFKTNGRQIAVPSQTSCPSPHQSYSHNVFSSLPCLAEWASVV